MRVVLLAGAALALANTALAASPPRFDLVCVGQERTAAGATPDSRRYTIDLQAKRWCRTAECSEGLAIEAVTPDEITFRRSKPGDALEHRHFISRVPGTFTETIVMPDGVSRTTGTCRPAPFSGLPKAKF